MTFYKVASKPGVGIAPDLALDHRAKGVVVDAANGLKDRRGEGRVRHSDAVAPVVPRVLFDLGFVAVVDVPRNEDLQVAPVAARMARA